MVGCDSSEDPQDMDGLGDFEITLTGDITDNFTGASTFAGSTTANSVGFGVFLGSNPSGHVVSLLKNSADRPSTGTYQIVDGMTDFEDLNENEFIATYIGTGSGTTTTTLSITGTLRITESSGNRLKGTISFTATGTSFDGTATTTDVDVTISGSFDAIGGVFQGTP